jgi:hypothetical protein
MSLKFNGTFHDLKACVCLTGQDGNWRNVNNKRQKQFRTDKGVILNWYQSTGTVHFQNQERDPKMKFVRKFIAAAESENRLASRDTGKSTNLKQQNAALRDLVEKLESKLARLSRA